MAPNSSAHQQMPFTQSPSLSNNPKILNSYLILQRQWKRQWQNKGYNESVNVHFDVGIIGCKQWAKRYSTTDELSWRSNKHSPPRSGECPHCPHTGDLLKGVTSNSGIFPTRGSSEAPRCTSLHQVFIILSLHWIVPFSPHIISPLFH